MGEPDKIDKLVEQKIGILKDYDFFRYFMDADVPDNKLFLNNLRSAFRKELRGRGFTKKELELLEHLTHLSTIPKDKRYGKLRIWLTAELSSEFITFNIVKNPLSKDLRGFYRDIYQRVFPEEEQEDLSTFMMYVGREGMLSPITHYFLKNEYGDAIRVKYYLLVVKIRGIIVGAGIFYTLSTKKLSFVILEYIVVFLDDLREIDSLKGFATGKYRVKIASALLNRCKSIAIKDAVKYGPGALSFIMAEVNDPVKMFKQGVLEEDTTNPVIRIRLYSQVGFRFMDFYWTQPSLGEGKEEIDYLYLIMMPFTKEWQGQIDPSQFKYAFLTYLATWKGVDLKKDRAVLRMRQELDTRTSANRPIKLMNYFDLKIPNEIIKACGAIPWKVKEGLKN